MSSIISDLDLLFKVKFPDFSYVQLVNTIILEGFDADPPNTYHMYLMKLLDEFDNE